MRCELNDLAFMNQALRPGNVGLYVTCKEYLGYYLKDDIIEISGENYVAFISDNYWLVHNSEGAIETQFGGSKQAYHPDTWLTPVKKDKLSDSVTTKKELFV